MSRQPAHEGDKVVSPTHRHPLSTPKDIRGTHLCQRLSRPQSHSAVGKIKSQRPQHESKLVPQLSAPPRTPPPHNDVTRAAYELRYGSVGV